MSLPSMIPAIPLGWDQDPRIVDPSVIPAMDAYHHRMTGAMVACYMLRGQWSDFALSLLHRDLRHVLPARNSSRITNDAEVRVAIHLGVARHPEATSTDLPPLEQAGDVDAALAASAWALDHGVAALGRGRPLGVRAAPALPPAQGDLLHRFQLADQALGDAWVPDGYPHSRGMGLAWTALRATTVVDVRQQVYRWSC